MESCSPSPICYRPTKIAIREEMDVPKRGRISTDANPLSSKQTITSVLPNTAGVPEAVFTTKVILQGGEDTALTSSVVPDSVVGQLHCVGVLGLLKVFVSVSAHVAAAADVPTYQTDPEVLPRERESSVLTIPSHSSTSTLRKHHLTPTAC